MEYCPSPEQFRQLAAKYNLIPLYTEISADMETPIALYLKLAGEQPGFMLESADSGKNFGRYSFIGLKPFAELVGYAEKTAVFGETGGQEFIEGKPLDVLRQFLAAFTVPELSGEPAFLGGGVGYFAYDLIATLERVRGYQLPEDLELMRLLFCRVIIIFDHLQHRLKVVYLASVKDSGAAAGSYDAGVQELQAVVEQLLTKKPVIPDDTPYRPAGQRFVPPAGESATAARYMKMVEAAKEFIVAGDAFQIVLSHGFTAPVPIHPFNLYRRLRQVNPSPYMFYLNYGQKKLIGASPEMLVKVEGDKVYTCPIAGTRPRGESAGEDERLAAELLADVKEKAEHAMLVDLGRNDIGRISAPGTVNVERLMQVEKFSHVMHLVSLVSGQLAAQYTALDALQACFPAGTVSGAPKVRAMEIIHELEGDCRGPYAGAVGYLDFRGNMDTCITIRTMAVDGSQATIRTGAGIVYDSVPAREYQEILQKGRALFQLMED